MHFNRLLVFDCDGTLYDDTQAKIQFSSLAADFCSKITGFEKKKAFIYLKELKAKWKTESAVVALSQEFKISISEATAETYLKIDFRLCDIPQDDVARANTLASLSDKKIVFTNSPSSYADRVLIHTGLQHYFSEVIGFEELNLFDKSDVLAYQIVESLYPEYEKLLLCDDKLENILIAKNRGWEVIWFNPGRKIAGRQDIKTIDSFAQLKQFL